MDTILTMITELLVGRFGVPADEIHPDVTFVDLDIDSLTLVELALAVEEEHGVHVSEDEIDAEGTVATFAKLINSKMTVSDVDV